MNLQDFLNANPVDNLTEEVAISPRFKDEKGNQLKFTIKAMTPAEFEDIRKKSTQIKKGKKVEFDNQLFNLSIAINHTVNPDFRNAESIKKLGLATPEDYVQKVLLAGELSTLVQKINELSGFDVAMNDLVDEVKN
ncbi:XkdN-like protein [Paenibacillus lautus]|uniref:phage tail assembly chaperone n=1 Tax=Paenibacillus lautus TaxID=1401 RepID=UPI002DB9BD42|nr:XkdN-like protein [Paenibacillus lautus]MEC0310185.1 XkdN-like protein [Paenibacillus lautus]